MRAEMVVTYEAECAYCGETWERGGHGWDNTKFIKELENMGWLIQNEKRANNYCSKECEQKAITEGLEVNL